MENIKTAKDFINNPEHKPNFQVNTTDGKTYWISRSVAVLSAIVSFDGTYWYILVNKRGPGCPDYQGMWNIPCGYVDWGETCEQACSREIWEECGLMIEPEKFKLFNVNSDPKESNKQNITIRHIVILDPIWMKMNLSDEHSEESEVADIKWIKLNDVDNYQWAFNHRELVDTFHEYLKNNA